MMVEELLQLLIAEVDAQLLESVELERRFFGKILYKIITFLFYCTVLDCFTLCYREDKVLGSPVVRIGTPPPHLQASVSPPFGSGRNGAHSFAGERGWPNSNNGDRHCDTLVK